MCETLSVFTGFSREVRSFRHQTEELGALASVATSVDVLTLLSCAFSAR